MISLVLAACTQPDGPVGSGIGSDGDEAVRVARLEVEVDISFTPSQTGTGASPHLYVGSAEGINSQALLKFSRPSKLFALDQTDSIASWSVDSVRMTLAFQGGIGSGIFSDPDAYLLDYEWSESAPPAWGTVPAGELLDCAVSTTGEDSGLVTFSPPGEWIDEWFAWIDSSLIDTTFDDPVRNDSSLTLHLECPAADEMLVRYRSRGATADSLRPTFRAFITIVDTSDNTRQDTLMSIAAQDLFIVDLDSMEVTPHLVIGGGAVFQSNLRFDVSPLWALSDSLHIVINRADLVLFKVSDLFPELPETPSIWPFRISDNLGFTFPDSAEEAGFSLTTAINAEIDSVSILITTPVSFWVKNRDQNWGIALHSGTEGLDIDRIAFYSSEAENPGLKPRLIVYYTEIPK